MIEFDTTEHLALSAQLAFSEGTSAANYWLKQQETLLFKGNLYQVAQTIINLADPTPVQEELLKT